MTMEEKKKRWRPSLTAYRELENEVESLYTKNSTIEKSNGFMEKELTRVREANKVLAKINEQLCNELQYIKSRGFWARVFNRF